MPPVRTYECGCFGRYSGGRQIYAAFSAEDEVANMQMLHNIAQPDFEGMLSDLLSQEANAEILRGWTWMSCEEVGPWVAQG